MSNALLILERAPLALESEEEITVARVCGDLPEKAARLLGYETLERHEARREQRSSLRRALYEAGIQPFTKGSVEKYKQEVADEANSHLLSQQRVTRKIMKIGFWGTVLATALSGWLVSIDASGAVFAGGLFLLFMVRCFRAMAENNPYYLWKIRPLKGYDKPVPEFVLHQALELKEALPEVEFFVDELVQRQNKKKALDDPFLVIRYGAYSLEDYYIAVWAEPKFEAKQKA